MLHLNSANVWVLHTVGDCSTGIVERQHAIFLDKPPSKRPGQLSIWKLITPQSDVYEKDAKLCVDSPPGL